MKKLLMWAVGVPFLVLGMVAVTFSDGGRGLMAPQAMSRTT
ncbi:MAG: hypothetical protein ABW067_09685 [Rhizobacter sp.]